MPDPYSTALLAGDVNLTVLALVIAIVAVVVFVVWRGTHDLDFTWGKEDVRVKVRASRLQPRKARAARKRGRR